jgi:hypothetical protein
VRLYTRSYDVSKLIPASGQCKERDIACYVQDYDCGAYGEHVATSITRTIKTLVYSGSIITGYYIVTYVTIARQRLGKHVTAESNARNGRRAVLLWSMPRSLLRNDTVKTYLQH